MPENMRPRMSSSDEEFNGGSSSSGQRVLRTLGMPEDERAARDRRRRRFRNRFSSQDGQKHEKESRTTDPTMAQAPLEENNTIDDGSMETKVYQERKPWETLVIGDLGENLSYIEEKDREIEQQRYILRYHEQNLPHEVEHHKKLLEDLIEERAQISDNEENNMLEDRREETNRIGERMDLLTWALETCECKAEEANIRAAIQGYQSGDIAYSRNFTLIYAGHIVDVCPTYRSFCEDRQERLDRYYRTFGPGWLWHEPPLSGPKFEVLAKKSLCLAEAPGYYQIGSYPVDLRFTVDRRKVMKGDTDSYEKIAEGSKSELNTEISCTMKTLLDSGATFPILVKQDLKRLCIDMKWYSAQGVMASNTMGGKINFRFFEMLVTVCSHTGESLVGEGNQAVWPTEPRVLGGFYPVQIDTSKGSRKRITYLDRLSGMVPFESCYMSSAPSLKTIWLGEDRRDVLGANRMPAHLRFDSQKLLEPGYPEDFRQFREEARTPDQVIFVHNLDNEGSLMFTDTDLPEKRGKSELAIVETRYSINRPGKRSTAKAVAINKAIVETVIEPRKGKYSEEAKSTPRWRNNFLSPEKIWLDAKGQEEDE
ncbi:hypothetical protein F5B20DRAFT_583032 [Whalleya microplaca]|nr:hypothetical protein F5B20DRAFT_583032 [Whalleya microplaca]